MAADVNLIVLAWEGREEADYELQATVLRAAGIKVPARIERRVAAQQSIADRLKAFAKANPWKPPTTGSNVTVVKPKT